MQHPKFQRGFYLTELLVSIYLAGFSLLSIASLAYTNLLHSYSSNLYAMAEQQALAATEIIRSGGNLQTWRDELLLPELTASYESGRAINLQWYDKYSQRYATVKLPCE